MSGSPGTLPPLALYVHLPWCVSKCPYCDFNSHPLHGALPADAYGDAVLRDLENMPDAGGRPLSSVFFGGGTPSLFPADTIQRILQAAVDRFGAEPDMEVTLEANPGSSDADRFRAYRRMGVNRLSIGAQSFDDRQLETLGRAHRAGDIPVAVDRARRAGFDNLNLDIMHGLPGQDTAAAMKDLQSAVGLSPEHLSWYQLTLEPGTVFYAQPPELPHEDECWQMTQQGLAFLADAGYGRYEVSAFAKPERRCLHNLNYWQYGDYLGAGAGAHGKITGHDGGVYRWSLTRSPALYMAGGQVSPQGPLDPAEIRFEFMLNALRLCQGFTEQLFADRTGQTPDTVLPLLRSARARGLMSHRLSESRWAPTDRGMSFLGDIQALFLPGQ